MLNLDDLHAGDTVDNLDVLELCKDCFLTRHAITRMSQRSGLTKYRSDGKLNYKETWDNIRARVRRAVISYVNVDVEGKKSINCCIDEFNYFVFAPSENGGWVMITYKEPSHNKINVYDKQQMAKNGVAYYYHDKH